jgi:hypothetical protein
MPNGKVKSPAAQSFMEQLMLAAAPGGALTRRPIFISLVGALVVLAIAFLYLLHTRARESDPAIVRLSDPGIAHLPTRSYVTDSPGIGHGEVRQYGLLDDTNKDVTVMMVIPPAGQSVARDFAQEVRTLDPVRSSARTAMARSYELQTRFGMFQAADLQIDMVGRWKDCIAFLSRFETPSIYVKGWYCDDVGTKPKADQLACALDSLVLDHSLPSPNAEAFMRQRIARPAFCGAIDRGEDRDQRALSGFLGP